MRLLSKFACVLSIFGASLVHVQAEPSEELASLKPADFPSQPIEFVLAFPAGGGLDTTARHIARAFERVTGATTIVTNRTGGAGFVGHNWFVTQAPNDGYTVAIFSRNFFNDAVVRANGAWSWTSVDPVAFINADPMIWFVSTAGRFGNSSLSQAMEVACASPGDVKVAISPKGLTERLAGLVEEQTGCQLTKIPYQGSAPTKSAILGGHLDIGFGQFTEYSGDLAAGTVKALAVAAHSRHPSIPDGATFTEELGGKPISIGQWRFVALPKDVPADRRAWLAAAFQEALASPEIVAEFERIGVTLDPSLDTPEKVAAAADEIGREEEEVNKLP